MDRGFSASVISMSRKILLWCRLLEDILRFFIFILEFLLLSCETIKADIYDIYKLIETKIDVEF